MKTRLLTALAFSLATLALWQMAVVGGLVPPFAIPSPFEVFRYLADAARDGSLLAAVGVTFRRLCLGYAVGVVAGLPIGVALARWQWCRDTVGMVALGLQTLPSVCWVPLAIVWFGQTELAMLFVVVMGCVWSVALATQSGIRTVPPIYVRAAHTMGSRGFHTLIYVTLPAALPQVIGGMKQGWAFAWRSLLAAEIYVTVVSGFGLGHLLHYGRELFAMDQVLGVMLIVMLSGLLVDRILFAPVETLLRRRWGVR